MSVFLPLEHARLAEASDDDSRASLFARYTLLGSLCAAVGALAAALPGRISALTGLPDVDALRFMFVLYGVVGCFVWLLYRSLPKARDAAPKPRSALGPSRPIVVRLAVLFSVDSFASGLAVNALLALWLFKRFDLSLASAAITSSGLACAQPPHSSPLRL